MSDQRLYETVRVSGQYTRKFGSHGYIIDDHVNLNQVLNYSDLVEDGGQTRYSTPTQVKYMHIYCDVLEVPMSEDGSLHIKASSPLRWLRIFARKLSIASTGLPKINCSQSNVERTTIIWNTSSINFNLFGFELNRSATTLGHDFIAGTSASASKMTEVMEVCPTEFKIRRPEAEMFEKLDCVESELSVFVRQQLHLAIAGMTPEDTTQQSISECLHNPDITSRLEFVTLLVKDDVMLADVRRAAFTLLYRLRVPENVRIWVPKSSFSSLQDSLTKWKDHAEAVENACDMQKIMDNGADEVLDKLTIFQLQDIKLDRKNFGDRYKEATDALVTLSSDFETFKDEFFGEKKAFESSVEKWKKAKHNEMVMDIVFAGVQIAAAIGIAFFTLGATAGGVVAAGSKLVDSAEKISDTVEKTEKALTKFQKLKLIFERIGKMKEWTEKAKAFYEKVNKVLNSNPKNPSDGLVKAKLVPPTDLESVNFYELLNQWDDFEKENEGMFKSMADMQPGIEGLGKFQLAMEKMIGRARHVIEAQKELQSIDNQLRLAVSHEEQRERRRQMFRKVDTLKGRKADELTPLDKRLLQHQIEQSLRTARLQMFLLLHETFCAYVFETNADYYPPAFHFNENKKVDKLLEYRAIMYQSHRDHFESGAWMNTNVPVRFTTSVDPDDTDNIFPPSWKELLVRDGQVPFSIPIGHQSCMNKSLAMIKSARLYFEGISRVAPKTSNLERFMCSENLKQQLVPLMIEFGPSMTQLDENRTQTQYFGSPIELPSDQPFSPGTNERSFSKIATGRMHPTLYTSGIVKLRQMGRDAWDLNTVTEIIMEVHVHSRGDAW